MNGASLISRQPEERAGRTGNGSWPQADIEVEGETRRVAKGESVFVAAEADHRFSGYESLTLLVIFNGPHSASKQS